MALKPKVTYTGKGKEFRQRLVDLIRKYPKASVTVGVHSDAGDYEGTDVSVAQVALWMEFGTPNARFPSPERSFVRSAIKESRDKIAAWRDEAIQRILMDGWSVEKALSMIGLRVQLLIQNKIQSNIPPPNADPTLYGMFGKPGKLALGQGSNTLIATGKLLRSITFQVHLSGSSDE